MEKPKWKRISYKKILRFEIENEKDNFYENEQILHIEGDTTRDVVSIIRNLTFDNFPNAFIITTHTILAEDSEFFSLLSRNLQKSKEFFLHVNFEGSFRAFHKKINSEKFEMIKTDVQKDIILQKLKSSGCCLTVESFFELLSYLKTLIIEADFSEILQFIEPNFDEFSLLKKVIQDQNEQLLKLLALFMPASYCLDELLKIAIQTANCDIFLTLLNNSKYKLSTLELEASFKQKILLRIAENGNVKALRDFSDFFNGSQTNFETWCQMREIASGKNFHKFIFELQKLENNFYELTKADKKLHNFHESIRNKNFGEVREFVENFPLFKFCIYQKTSALEKSIDEKSLFIYSYLLSEEFICENQEILDKEIDKLELSERCKIRNFNLDYLKECPEKLINILASRCKFLSNSNSMSAKETREMLESIKNIEGVEDMMKVLVLSNVTIAKDLKNRYICTINPNKRQVLGRAANDMNIIYVGKAYNAEDRGITFVHEMTHYVLMLVYENDFLPYCNHDSLRNNEFDEIFKKIEEIYENDPENTDKIIASIFINYKSDKRKEELIARVPHLLAFYHKNEVEMRAIKAKYSELFNFFRTKVLPDQQPNFYRMIKFNNDFGLVGKIVKYEYQVRAQVDLNSFGCKILFLSKTPDLVLSKIVNEMKEFSSNKITFKATNIFIDVIHVEQERFMWELTNLMKDSCVTRIIVDVRKAEKDKILNYTTYPPGIKCYAVISQNEGEIIETLKRSGFEKFNVDIEWLDLFKDSQKKILEKKIKFQSIELTIAELFKDPKCSISSEVLAILCTNDKISINCEISDENWDDFIPRRVLKKTAIPWNQNSPNTPKFEFSELTTENFIKSSRTAKNFANKILISDPAGAGKTFLFKKICDEIKSGSNFKELFSHFVLFFPLKNHLNELKIGVGKNFVEFISKIGKFDALTKAIFTEKYNLGETILFFDAFDEISPKCESETKELFKIFEAHGRNQIFISTRTHLEEDLEKEFEILANKIKNLTDNEQVTYLTKFWHKFNTNELFVEESAKKLVKKITEIISTQPRLIGVPIIVKSLAEIFSDKIKNGVNFEDEIRNLNIAEIYRKITIEKLLRVSIVRYENQPLFDYSQETVSPIQMHIFIAVKHLFDEELANNLIDSYNKTIFPLEEIARFGIVKYSKEGIDFHHETNAEYLMAYHLFTILENKSAVSKSHYVFLFKIILTQKFVISRLFLDSMLEKIEDFESSMKFFNIEMMFCGYMRQNNTCLNNCALEGHFNIFDFLMSVLFKNDINNFNFFLNHEMSDLTLFMRVLKGAKKANRFGKFLDKVSTSQGSFEKFITRSSENIDTSDCGMNIIFIAAQEAKSVEIFEKLYSKSLECIQDEGKVREIFLQRHKVRKSNIYQYALKNSNDSRIFEFIFDISKNYFKNNKKEFESFIFDSDNAKQNVVTEVACNGHAENIKKLFHEIDEILGIQGLKRSLQMKGGYPLKNLLSLALSNSVDSNEALWEIFEANFTRDEKIFLLTNEITLYDPKTKQTLKFLIEKIKKYIENFHEFLLRENILLKAAEGHFLINITISSYLEVFCENFPSVKDFIYKTDDFGNNILHLVAISSNIKMIEFVLNFLKTNLSTEDFEAFLNLKNEKDECILHIPTQRADESEVIEFVLEYIESEFGKDKLKDFLSVKDKWACVPLCKPLQQRNEYSLCVCIEIFLFLITIYEKLFTHDEIENFLKLRDKSFYQNAFFYVKIKANKPMNAEERTTIFSEILEKYNITDVEATCKPSPTSHSL